MQLTQLDVEIMDKTRVCPACGCPDVDLLGESGEFWLECPQCHIDVPLE